MSPEDFMKTLLMLSNENILYIFSSLQERYTVPFVAENLVDELDFLKEVQKLLLAEVIQRQGKLSRYILSISNELYLERTINDLEKTKNRLLQNNT